MEYLTTVEVATRWNISSRRVALLCEQGRIDGVIKKGKTWLIPRNSKNQWMQGRFVIIINEVY